MRADLRLRSGQAGAVGLDDGGVPEGGTLGDAAARREIDEEHAEALRVAFLPFEIVEQRPMKIAEERDALSGGASEGDEIARGEVDALRIVHFAVERNPVARRAAVFGDENG